MSKYVHIQKNAHARIQTPGPLDVGAHKLSPLPQSSSTIDAFMVSKVTTNLV